MLYTSYIYHRIDAIPEWYPTDAIHTQRAINCQNIYDFIEVRFLNLNMKANAHIPQCQHIRLHYLWPHRDYKFLSIYIVNILSRENIKSSQ